MPNHCWHCVVTFETRTNICDVYDCCYCNASAEMPRVPVPEHGPRQPTELYKSRMPPDEVCPGQSMIGGSK